MLQGCISNNALCINIIVFNPQAHMWSRRLQSRWKGDKSASVIKSKVRELLAFCFFWYFLHMYNLWWANDFCLISLLQVMQLLLPCVQLKNGNCSKLEPSSWYTNVWMLFSSLISILSSLAYLFGNKTMSQRSNLCRGRKEFIFGTPLYLVK